MLQMDTSFTDFDHKHAKILSYLYFINLIHGRTEIRGFTLLNPYTT